MAIYKQNLRSDGCCYLCGEKVPPKDLVQCGNCFNFFCEKDIQEVEDYRFIMRSNRIKVCARCREIITIL